MFEFPNFNQKREVNEGGEAKKRKGLKKVISSLAMAGVVSGGADQALSGELKTNQEKANFSKEHKLETDYRVQEKERLEHEMGAKITFEDGYDVKGHSSESQVQDNKTEVTRRVSFMAKSETLNEAEDSEQESESKTKTFPEALAEVYRVDSLIAEKIEITRIKVKSNLAEIKKRLAQDNAVFNNLSDDRIKGLLSRVNSEEEWIRLIKRYSLSEETKKYLMDNQFVYIPEGIEKKAFILKSLYGLYGWQSLKDVELLGDDEELVDMDDDRTRSINNFALLWMDESLNEIENVDLNLIPNELLKKLLNWDRQEKFDLSLINANQQNDLKANLLRGLYFKQIPVTPNNILVEAYELDKKREQFDNVSILKDRHILRFYSDERADYSPIEEICLQIYEGTIDKQSTVEDLREYLTIKGEEDKKISQIEAEELYEKLSEVMSDLKKVEEEYRQFLDSSEEVKNFLNDLEKGTRMDKALAEKIRVNGFAKEILGISDNSQLYLLDTFPSFRDSRLMRNFVKDILIPRHRDFSYNYKVLLDKVGKIAGNYAVINNSLFNSEKIEQGYIDSGCRSYTAEEVPDKDENNEEEKRKEELLKLFVEMPKPSTLVIDAHGDIDYFDNSAAINFKSLRITPEELFRVYQTRWEQLNPGQIIKPEENDIFYFRSCFGTSFAREFYALCDKENYPKPIFIGEAEYGRYNWFDTSNGYRAKFEEMLFEDGARTIGELRKRYRITNRGNLTILVPDNQRAMQLTENEDKSKNAENAI